LNGLKSGQTVQEIIGDFEGDKQLVEMWISFLFHNHWMEKDDSKWQVSTKGREWAERST
jgi:hypothetical protein